MIWVCPSCNETVESARRCLGRTCPRCGEGAWAWKRARAAWDRLRAGARYYTLHWRPRHVTISFDHQAIPRTSGELQAQRRAVYRTLERMGFYGGLAVFHPWRKRCLGCGEPYEGSACPSCGTSPGLEWVRGPHWHVVGYGRVDADKRPAGVVVKAIPRKGSRSWTATIKYALDHCGGVDGRHALTWFGAWSYAKLPMAKIRRWIHPDDGRGEASFVPRCPRCGEAMEPLASFMPECGTDRPPPRRTAWLGVRESDPLELEAHRPGPGVMG